MTLDIAADNWQAVDNAILEIEWYATHKVNLAGIHGSNGTWAEMLLSDIKDLREALAKTQGSVNKPKVEQ